MSNALPLSIRDTPPFPGAVRLTGIRPDGLPDGFHTGGAWEYANMIYKPLDGRPYANCENHYPTDEAQVLEEMAGQPLFPRNWTIEQHNNRWFIVRKKAFIVGGKEVGWKDLSLEQVLHVEEGIRNLNAHWWEIGDLISLGIDPDTYELFLVDCSTALKRSTNAQGCYIPDEEWRITRFFELTRFEVLKKRRQAARHEVHESSIDEKHPAYTSFARQQYRFVYGSYNRPFSTMWGDRLRKYDLRFKHQLANWNEGIPHTWIMSTTEIDQETLDRYELVWCWLPIQHIQGEN